MVPDDPGRLTREVRSDRTLSFEQLALMTGICAPALSEIENEQRDPRIATLNRIAEALPVPLAFLNAGRVGIAERAGQLRSAGYDVEE
jgi:transcriptional regulator with XRE-family HTH domain